MTNGCEGTGHSGTCSSNPRLISIRMTDLWGNTITSAVPTYVVHLRAEVYGPGWSCSNFTLRFLDNNDFELKCIEGTVNRDETIEFWAGYVPDRRDAGKTVQLKVVEELAVTTLTTSLYIEGTPPLCSDWRTQAECEAAACYWHHDWCWGFQPTCVMLENQADCERFGCYWVNGVCQGEMPVCTEGETKCVGYTLMECRDGGWFVIEDKSPSCGYVPPPPPECSPDGITQCVGYHLYKCINGIWELIEQNSPACDYVPPIDRCKSSIDALSVFYTGPFEQGTNQKLTHLVIRNDGELDCLIYARFVENPGTENERQLDSIYQRVVPSGGTSFIDFIYETPVNVDIWKLGVKIWASEYESEPSWGG